MVDNVALITGGSSGIGAEFATQLAAKGYNMLIISNQDKALIDKQNEISQLYPSITCHQLCIDLSCTDSAETIMSYCHEHELVVNVLINNAGIFSFKEILNHSQQHINLYIDLHLRAITQLCYLFGKEMQQRKEGYILNMSSMSCWMPMPGIGMYAATKAYIRVFSRSLQLELKESGVKVMVACPGGIATSLFGLSPKLLRLGVTLQVLVTPDKFVNNALRHLFRGRKQYINGLINRIAIVAVSIIPTRMRLIIRHKLLYK